jgi:hypothetical protein
MKASGRFVAEQTFAGQGMVKLVVSAADDRILGIHAVGAYSSEFIWGGAALIEQEMRVSDVSELIFPHPTVCELIHDSSLRLFQTASSDSRQSSQRPLTGARQEAATGGCGGTGSPAAGGGGT